MAFLTGAVSASAMISHPSSANRSSSTVRAPLGRDGTAWIRRHRAARRSCLKSAAAGLLAEIKAMGVERVSVTLDVGVGTFRPVEVDDPGLHIMHSERYCVPEATARAVTKAKRDGRRVWAVGTTVVRALESAAGESGEVESRVGSTELFIRPPYDFRVVDALITNFHLPRSTLIMLVAAFGGYERTMNAYEEAIRLGFGFYSYGDSMVVL